MQVQNQSGHHDRIIDLSSFDICDTKMVFLINDHQIDRVSAVGGREPRVEGKAFSGECPMTARVENDPQNAKQRPVDIHVLGRENEGMGLVLIFDTKIIREA